MGCTINKAGSTSINLSLKYLRLKYDFPNSGRKLWEMEISATNSQLRNRRNQYEQFIVVREPMERLASCYRDKMRKHERYPFIIDFRNYVKKSRINHRVNGEFKRFDEKVTFADFLKAVVLPAPPSEYEKFFNEHR